MVSKLDYEGLEEIRTFGADFEDFGIVMLPYVLVVGGLNLALVVCVDRSWNLRHYNNRQLEYDISANSRANKVTLSAPYFYE